MALECLAYINQLDISVGCETMVVKERLKNISLLTIKNKIYPLVCFQFNIFQNKTVSLNEFYIINFI